MVGTYTSASQLSCLAPSHAPGIVAVAVSTNAADFSTNTTTFQFTGPLFVSAVVPSFGVTTGGTVATVLGGGFASSVIVFFNGSALATASVTVDSSSQIRCAVPASGVSPVFVEVTNNGIEVTASRSLFTYYGTCVCPETSFEFSSLCDCVAIPYLTSVSPSLGPTHGGTLVSVFGLGFFTTDAIVCRFGTAVVSGQMMTSTSLACESPTVSTARVVAVDVSMNGQDFTTNGLAFSYFGMRLLLFPFVFNSLPFLVSPNVTALSLTAGSTSMFWRITLLLYVVFSLLSLVSVFYHSCLSL